MLLPSVILALSTLTAVYAVWETGAPCQSQFTLKPLGSNTNVNATDPPYVFSIRNRRGESVTSYAPKEIYTLRLSGSEYFRAFVIQARVATKDRFIIGHLRAGQFIPGPAWNSSGIQIQNCPPVSDNSITNSNNDQKFIIEANWTTDANLGPVQFFITVIQEDSVFWTRWKPETGFLLPDKTVDFDRQASIQQPPPSSSHSGESADARRLPVQQQLPDLFAISATPATGTTVTELHAFNKVDRQQPAVQLATRPQPFVGETIEGSGEGSESSNDALKQTTATITLPDLNDPNPIYPLNETDFRPEDQFVIAQQSQTQNVGKGDDNVQSSDPAKGVPPPSATDVKEQSTTTTATTTATTSTGGEELLTQKSVVEEIDPQTGRFVKLQKVVTAVADYCAGQPCKNGGNCQVDTENDDFFCVCAAGFTGETCGEVDHCLNNKCKNGAICKNGVSNYTCQCATEWGGEFCDRQCPSYLCENGGKCIITNDGSSYGCICRLGWTGQRCSQDENDCASNPCQHGLCVDKLNGYECQCQPGYMGENCHRPCQDVYKSCTRWKHEDRCNSMRPVTRFFDVNCAVTCKQCTPLNNTVKTEKTLPPVLEPFVFLIGRWVAGSSTPYHYPVDFSTTTTGYTETWDITVNEVPMFGTPAINFTSRAVSKDDANDTQVIVGFLTLDARHQKGRPYDVALMSTGNDGITFVEEGQLNDHEVTLKIRYHTAVPQLAGNVPLPESSERIIKLFGQRLTETVNKQDQAGVKSSYTKYFTRIEEYAPY